MYGDKMIEKDYTQLLETLLSEFHHKINNLNGLINREIAFPLADNKIKVVIGMRRTGKTYFLYQHILTLLKSGVKLSNILYINTEDDRLFPLTAQTLGTLVDHFYARYPENHTQKCYLFFDEIQVVENWPVLIRRLHDTKTAELFLTGSSAKLLSKEIATNLRGRSLAIEMWPYSFHEYLRAHQLTMEWEVFGNKEADQLTHHFQRYLNSGGFPELTHYDDEVSKATLQEYIELVLYRDIVERHAIQYAPVIKYMILSLLHNASSAFSINKLYNVLKSQGYKIGRETLHQYTHYIEDAYLSFFVNLYDSSFRKIQVNPKKVYAIDTGLVKAVTLNDSKNLGRLFKNIIFIDLKRKKCEVHYYLTQDRYEIDFVVQPPQGEKQLLQVVWDATDTKTLAREERALSQAKKELGLPGRLLTLRSYLKEGIF